MTTVFRRSRILLASVGLLVCTTILTTRGTQRHLLRVIINNDDSGPCSTAQSISDYVYPNKTPPVLVPLDAVCSSSNPSGNNATAMEFLVLRAVQEVVREYENQEFALERRRNFFTIGRRLYAHAQQTNTMLLTVQIGGMDGVSNDPMHLMLVQQQPNDKPPFQSLAHWFPVVVEPVPDNYLALQAAYGNLVTSRQLPCPVLVPWAISYDSVDSSGGDHNNGDNTTTQQTCTFCSFDTSSTAPAECQIQPDWKRRQLGTLDCAYFCRYFRTQLLEQCVRSDTFACGSLEELLRHSRVPAHAPIAILQVDTEGYESVLIPALLQNLADEALPPVIHFEHKVMRHLDRISKSPTSTRAIDTNAILRERGYMLYDEGEDILALRVGGMVSS